MSAKKQREADKAESLESLREVVKPGDTLTCISRGRTANGTRFFDVYKFGVDKDGEPTRWFLSYHIARAQGLRWSGSRDCISHPYINMDPGFQTVYTLARTLFGDGYALKSEWL